VLGKQKRRKVRKEEKNKKTTKFTSGNNQHFASDGFVSQKQLEWSLTQINLLNDSVFEFGSKTLGLLRHVVNQCVAINALNEARKVFDFGGGC
jgi:hypothetical protein